MGSSKPRLLLRATSEFMVLPQPGFMLMSMTHGATKGHTDAKGLGRNLSQVDPEGYAATGVTLIWVAYIITWSYDVIQAMATNKGQV